MMTQASHRGGLKVRGKLVWLSEGPQAQGTPERKKKRAANHSEWKNALEECLQRKGFGAQDGAVRGLPYACVLQSLAWVWSAELGGGAGGPGINVTHAWLKHHLWASLKEVNSNN